MTTYQLEAPTAPTFYTAHLTAEQATEQGYADTIAEYERDATLRARYTAPAGTTLTHQDGRTATLQDRDGDNAAYPWEITAGGEHIAWTNGHGVVDFH